MNDRHVSEISKNQNSFLIAPAGCGKTELIVNAVELLEGKQLILTHTHAGVDSLRRRFRIKNIPSSKFTIETIASFSLKFVKAYPSISGYKTISDGEDWELVNQSMINLLRTELGRSIILASYAGVFVDEYQDCILSQHRLIVHLSKIIPCRVLGDPLQGIFGFGKEPLVDWVSDVRKDFSPITEMSEPWRWKNKNEELGEWLMEVREKLLNGEEIDLSKSPSCVNWKKPIPKEKIITSRIVAGSTGQIIIIFPPKAKNLAHAFAKNLQGLYKSMEEMEAKDLQKWCELFEGAKSKNRVEHLIDFSIECISGIKEEIEPIKNSFISGRKTKKAEKYPELMKALNLITSDDSFTYVLEALREIEKISSHRKIYRMELWQEMKKTLELKIENDDKALLDSAIVVRNITRILGRRLHLRTISRTLLIKGLEYQHVIIMDADSLDRNNLYVALTRGIKTITVFSNSSILKPKAVS